MTDEKLPVLRAHTSQIAERTLVVGDPKRAEICAALLDGAEEVGYYREYRTFTGTYNGTPITICSHGVGSAGASVAFHELFVGGVKTVIRAGTCGAMQKGIRDGDVIIATGAIRCDGTTPMLIPIEYPAVAHYQVINSLLASCKTNGITNPPCGLTLSKANFYPGLIEDPMEMWMDAGVVAVEQELAVLLVMANIRGLRAGGILTSDGNLAETQSQVAMEDFAYDPHRDVVKQGTEKMLRVALETLASLD